MVGRLIEQQHVGGRQQESTQRDAPFLASREGTDLRLPGRQAQGVGGDLQLAFQLPAAGGVDGVLQLGLFLQERRHLVVRHGLGELVADLVEFFQQLEGGADPFHDRGAYVFRVIELGLLRQEADTDTGLRTSLAVKGRVRSGHDAQQG